MYRNHQTHRGHDLGNDIYKLKNIFDLLNEFQSLNNYLKYKYRRFYLEGYVRSVMKKMFTNLETFVIDKFSYNYAGLYTIHVMRFQGL